MLLLEDHSYIFMLKNLKLSSNTGIIIGVSLVLLGIGLLSSNYINIKKRNLVTKLNIKLYDEIIPQVVVDEKIPTIDEKEEEKVQIEEASKETAKPTYTYYKGVIEIPKINLKNGFLDINSKYNNIENNVTVISPSDYPNVDNGNLILAAHSGTGYIAFFKNLYKLNKKDQVYIYYNGIKYTYEIKDIYTQPKVGELEVRRRSDKKTLTLITCTEGDDKTQTVYIAEIK